MKLDSSEVVFFQDGSGYYGAGHLKLLTHMKKKKTRLWGEGGEEDKCFLLPLNEALVSDLSVSLPLSRGLCVTHQRVLSAYPLTLEEQKRRRRRQLPQSVQWYSSTLSTEGQ